MLYSVPECFESHLQIKCVNNNNNNNNNILCYKTKYYYYYLVAHHHPILVRPTQELTAALLHCHRLMLIHL